MKNVKVENVTGRNGEAVKNQFIIVSDEGTWFQSYKSIIVFVPRGIGGKITLDSYYWDYSKTTGKYRNIFLGETKAEIEAKIKSGEYVLADLNVQN